MDYVTRQFINLTKKFRKDFRKYANDLNRALHKQTDAICKSTESHDDEQRPSPEIIATVNLPESIEVHQKAEDTRDERNYRRATFFVTGLTLGAIAVYAGLVYWQYREMINATIAAQTTAKAAQDAITQARDQFRQDERPYIWVTNNGIGEPGFFPKQHQYPQR